MEEVYTYIDHCLIEEYGTPNRQLNCFELDIDDLPEREIDNLLHRLLRQDSNMRDLVHNQIQQLIDKRLREVTL
jgi:hypothetical protein